MVNRKCKQYTERVDKTQLKSKLNTKQKQSIFSLYVLPLFDDNGILAVIANGYVYAMN